MGRFLLLAFALFACSHEPKPRTRPPESLDEINAALSWRFADVILTDRVVLHDLRGVAVSPERLSWLNEEGLRREMPIDRVARIVLRDRDPAAHGGAKSLADGPPRDTILDEDSGLGGGLGGSTGAVVGVAYTALALAAGKSAEAGVLIYEAPVTRYLPPATASPDSAPADPPEP